MTTPDLQRPDAYWTRSEQYLETDAQKRRTRTKMGEGGLVKGKGWACERSSSSWAAVAASSSPARGQQWWW